MFSRFLGNDYRNMGTSLLTLTHSYSLLVYLHNGRIQGWVASIRQPHGTKHLRTVAALIPNLRSQAASQLHPNYIPAQSQHYTSYIASRNESWTDPQTTQTDLQVSLSLFQLDLHSYSTPLIHQATHLHLIGKCPLLLTHSSLSSNLLVQCSLWGKWLLAPVQLNSSCRVCSDRALNYSDLIRVTRISGPTRVTRINLPSTRILSTSSRKARILLLTTSFKACFVILPAESGKIVISSNSHRPLKILFLIIVVEI